MADRSGYIGREPGDSSIVISRQTFNPTGVQTDFTFSSGYIPGYLDVYLNGVRLIEANDYTATDTSVVGLTSAAQNGDVLEMVAYKAFNIAVVSEALSDFIVGNNLNVSGDVTVTGDHTTTGDVSGRNFTGVAATFTGNVTVGGVLTYEDVTNVDSLGILTARTGVHVLAGGVDVDAGGINVIGGNVGIGTSVASTKLDVRGTIVSYGSTTSFTRITNAGSIEIRKSAGGFIDFSTDDGEDFDCRIKQTSTNDLTFFTGGNGSSAEALRITSDGNLQVTGTISAAQDYPTIRPTLDLNFAASKTLDRRITFTRDSLGTFTDDMGIVKYASNNVPRFDHDPTTGESLGLLIEESRTNSLTYSNSIGGTGWTNGRTTTLLNTTASPDGSTTASKIVGASPNQVGNKRVFQTITLLDSTEYTYSIYAKASELSGVRVLIGTNVEGAYSNGSAKFDLSNGTVNSGTGTITDVGNGWYRCTVKATTTQTASSVFIYPLDASFDANFTGDGSSGIFVWGAQLEQGSFATSYIPTTVSTVTRGAENVVIKGTNFTSFHNATEGTLYGEYKSTSETAPYIVMLSDGTNNNRTIINANYDIYQGVVKYNNDANQAVIDGGTPIANANNKTALAFKKDDFALSLNGGTVATDTSGDVSVNTMLTIGSRLGSDSFANTTINGIKYYTKRLSNAQLQGLTS